MYNKCCVVSCGSRRKDVSLYRFPKSEIGLNKWLQCINCERLRSLSYEHLRKHFVCQKHFEKRFLASRHVRSRIRVGAYPTLFTQSEIASGVPRQNNDHTENAINTDHDYSKKRQHEDHLYCKIEVAEKRPRKEIELDVMQSILHEAQHDIENIVPSNLPSTSGISNLTEKPIAEELDVMQSIPHAALHDVGNVWCNLPSTSGISNLSEKPIAKELDVMQSILHEAQHDIENIVPSNLPSTSGISNLTEKPIAKDVGSTPKSSKSLLRRKRVISKKNTLSPRCARLYQEYFKSRKQLEFSKRAKRAMQFSKQKCFETLTKNINPLAKKILWMQINQCTKKAKGRRFTDEEKLIALSIMKQSPKCYRFLHRIFILPSKYTLNKMVAGLNVEAGVNAQILEAVKKEVVKWEENKKFCSILFDEVALEPGLTYDKHKDYIKGFVELTDRTNDFADHALVFLLRGAIHKWQQPLAFYFCKGATSGAQLKIIIKEIIAAVCNTGLLPVALISDQGTAFQSALKSLQEDTRREQILAGDKIDDVITVNGHTLSVIYDPPHLIKGLRNNFLTKNITYNGKISKWSDIVEVYKTDCSHAHVRLLHKLNDEHVIPEKIKKMKVKNCVKALSKTMAATLAYTAQFSQYVNGDKVSPTLKNTSEIVSFLDDLFDSVNGASLYSKKNKGKPLRHAVTQKSPNHEFWKEAIEKINKIRFIDGSGKETSVPSLKNWIVTLKSFQRLWQFFKSKNIKIMRPRYYNSDPIENFFEQMRAYNFRNNDPNCHTFVSTFRSLLITRFIQFHSESYNCEEDSGEQLLKLKALFNTKERVENLEHVISSTESSSIQNVNRVEVNIPTSAREERLNIHSRAFTTGWVVRKILKKVNCEQCKANLTTDEKKIETNSIHNWITFREFKSINDRKLTYPSECAVRLFGDISVFTNKYLEENPQKKGIAKYLKEYMYSKYSCEFLTCDQHKSIVREIFCNLTLRLTVFNWCNIINKILKGTDVIRLENKSLPPMQLKALNKYKTRMRNKRLQK